MTDFNTRSAAEADTHRLFDTYIADRKGSYDPYIQMASTVFKASHHSSLPLARIQMIAEALCGFNPGQLNDDAMKDALGQLVRAKVLRSRVLRGVRHWEVNY
jgi:hypothetical protein